MRRLQHAASGSAQAFSIAWTHRSEVVMPLVSRTAYTRKVVRIPTLALIAASFVLTSGCVPSAAPILLFNGTGASPNDVAAVEAVLNNNHLAYATATSWQLNWMDQSQI